VQRDLWKRFNQMLVVPIVGVGVLYVALEPSTPTVDTEVASATEDASPIDVGVSAHRDIDPTTVPPADVPFVTAAPGSVPRTSATAPPVPATAAPTTTPGAALVAPTSTTAPTTTTVTSTTPTTTTTTTTVTPVAPTTPTSTTVVSPPQAVTTTTIPGEPECLVRLALPLGDGWLCVIPGAGALIS
jgi:hypothetical protein